MYILGKYDRDILMGKFKIFKKDKFILEFKVFYFILRFFLLNWWYIFLEFGNINEDKGLFLCF